MHYQLHINFVSLETLSLKWKANSHQIGYTHLFKLRRCAYVDMSSLFTVGYCTKHNNNNLNVVTVLLTACELDIVSFFKSR